MIILYASNDSAIAASLDEMLVTDAKHYESAMLALDYLGSG
jgi:hypothetical protein